MALLDDSHIPKPRMLFVEQRGMHLVCLRCLRTAWFDSMEVGMMRVYDLEPISVDDIREVVMELADAGVYYALSVKILTALQLPGRRNHNLIRLRLSLPYLVGWGFINWLG